MSEKDYLLEAYKQVFCEDCEDNGKCDENKVSSCCSEYIEKVLNEMPTVTSPLSKGQER